jgi:hypothetical protein
VPAAGLPSSSGHSLLVGLWILAERLYAKTALCGDMAKHWLKSAVPLLFLVSHPLIGQNDSANSGSWSGVIVNSESTLDEVFAESAKCTENRGPTAKLSLYDDTIRQLCALDPQV